MSVLMTPSAAGDAAELERRAAADPAEIRTTTTSAPEGARA